MTLGFKTQIGGQPTYFPEKIWSGLLENNILHIGEYESYRIDCESRFDVNWDLNINLAPKLHTIREDAKNNWPPAKGIIHMVINNRTPNRFQFAPVIKYVSVQTIKIRYDHHHDEFPMVFIDGYAVHEREDHAELLNKLAINDGFDDIDGFFNYFDKNFTGKIIHWTDLKY